MPAKLENLWSGAGRFVMGSLTEKSAKDHEGKPIPPEKQAYFIGVAIPKTDPQIGVLWPQLYNLAATDYASVPLVMREIQQGLAARDFSWKIEDGDVPQFDKKTGQPRPTPEYLKGCLILKFRTQFDLSTCDDQNRDIARSDIKRGDYVDVVFSAQINGKMDATAGIYLNPIAVRRLGFGDTISGQVQASQVFGNAPAAILPPGASAQPTASAPPALPPGASYAPAPQPQYAPAPQPQYAPAPQPQYAPAPQPQYAPAPQPQVPLVGAPAPAPMGYAVNPVPAAPQYAPQPIASHGAPAPYPGILTPGQ